MSSLDDLFAQLHHELATELLTRLRSGEASTSDLNQIRQFLKDNGIDNSLARDSSLSSLVQEFNIPFTHENEWTN